MARGMPDYSSGGFWRPWFRPGGTPRAYGYSDPADPNATIYGGNAIVGGGGPGGTYPFGTAYANRQGRTGGQQGTGAQNMAGMSPTSPYLDQGVYNNYGYGGLFQPMSGNRGLAPGTDPNIGFLSGSNRGKIGAPGPGMYGSSNWFSPPSSNPSEFSTYIGKEGNVTYSPVGEQERLLDMLFSGAVSGQGGGPIGNQLFNLAQGQLPPALAQQIMAGTSEQFGKMGARFGTDLGTAMSRGLAQASEAQSLDAIRQILGLGGTTAGFQFARGESGLNRAMQEFTNQQQQDPMMSIIGALLGGSGMGG